jgi:invasion protein IalB
MSARSLLAAAFALAALATPLAARAQDASASSSSQDASAPASSQAAVPPANAAPAQNWMKVCGPPVSGKRTCVMRQVVVTPKNQFLGSFLLRDDPGQDNRLLAVAALPLGMILPFGVTWQIDRGPQVRTSYLLCDPQSCATQMPVNQLFVNSLEKGSKLTLTGRTAKGDPFVVSINLQGFTDVYNGDQALTIDEFNQEMSGGSALEKGLADRAEQARQKLSGDSSSSAPPSSSSAPAQ